MLPVSFKAFREAFVRQGQQERRRVYEFEPSVASDPDQAGNSRIRPAIVRWTVEFDPELKMPSQAICGQKALASPIPSDYNAPVIRAVGSKTALSLAAAFQPHSFSGSKFSKLCPH